MSATKQQLATKKGLASTVDINLRTMLLAHHAKLETKLGSNKWYCLGRHRVSRCTSKNRCHKCQRKHHTSICSTPDNSDPLPENSYDLSINSNTVSTSNGTASPTQQITQVESHLIAVPTVPATSASLHSTGSYTCLLKTAIGNVAAKSYCVEANILFDEGSQRSFLSQNLADRLNLHPHTTETVALSTFGNQGTRAMKVPINYCVPSHTNQTDYTT